MFPIDTTPNMGRSFYVGAGTAQWVVTGERPGQTVTAISLRSHTFRTFDVDDVTWLTNERAWRQFRRTHRGKRTTEVDEGRRKW
jgi:hypothetical protein